ncbi:hypothetical protein QE152_g6332 [Popillia japonica]|uniref:Uncharacterized protein n=1 Tax=Popillia japonica TaxID=7064 RepID=A0AAW1MK30_POPJA
MQTTNDIERVETSVITIANDEAIIFNNSNEDYYNHDTNAKSKNTLDINELKTFNCSQENNSISLHERIVEQMIESSILNVPMPISPSNYEYSQSISDLPKCLMENNGGKFD